MNDDARLIRRFGQEGDEAAFAELMSRHLSLVWGAARRITGDGELARDIAQGVFVDLARKARSLPEGVVVAGWLHRAACHAAGNAVRSQVRRVRRERLAMVLASESEESTPDPRLLENLESLVDEALMALPESDREVLVLRYFRALGHAEIGGILGIGDDAAQKRTARALERLREHFRAHGVAVGAGVVAAAVQAAGSEAVPTWVVQGVTAAQVFPLAGAGSGAVAGLLSMKTPLFLAVTAVLGGVIVWQAATLSRTRRERLVLEVELAQARASAARPDPVGVPVGSDAEILRLRAKVAELTRQQKALEARSKTVVQPEPMPIPDTDVVAAMAQYNTRLTMRVNAGKTLGLAARLFVNDNQEAFPTTFEGLQGYLGGTGGTLAGGIPLEQFEFFPQTRAVQENEPQMILFRERQAEPRPDGGWTRIYVLADGSVQQVSTDEQVLELERNGTAH